MNKIKIRVGKRSGFFLVILLGLFVISSPVVYANSHHVASCDISLGKQEKVALSTSGGTMRKEIVGSGPLNTRSATTGELDLVNIATVQLTSEDSAHPIENAFDQQQGKGASYWAAATAGAQTITLVFDHPQAIRKIQLEIEELETSRTQVLQVSVSHNGGQNFEKVLQQDYTFSPPGTTLQREEWTVNLEQVTHFRLHIIPDRDDHGAIAKLSSLILFSQQR